MSKDNNNKDQENLDKLRHSAAHLLAAAVLELYPNAKPTIGPAIENGFYYDFDFGDVKVSDEDLPKIQEKMLEIVKDWKNFERIEVDSNKAMKKYSNNEYKQELIKEFSEQDEQLTLYKSGEFVDLCRGGHVENPNEVLQHFTLMNIAGAYWRGDENNPMLTRIYGIAFPSESELKEHLEQIEEAKKRDHKALGKTHDLFTFSDLVGSGLPLWTPKGTLIRTLLDDFVWELRKEKGYQKVEIPHITKKELYEASGHWDKFSDELFKIQTREGHLFAMKPMNCPHHTQIFDRKSHSYKEMPQRYANSTMVYRDEQSGELSGLSRVRAITQDDAHVFCTSEQIKEEINAIWDIVDSFYGTVGIPLIVSLSLRDPNSPDKYLGKTEDWNRSEDQLREIAKDRGEVEEYKGEAAFYGPKIDFLGKDSLGRTHQVATIQLDMNMPDRFDLNFINDSGDKERAVMIHAAIMGSIERYLSILIEHFAAAFPLWLSPVQVKILPITDRNLEYAQRLKDRLEEVDIRVELDDRSETLGSKIRDAQKEKVPYMIIIGDKEQEANKVAVRLRTEEDLGQMELNSFKNRILEIVENKSLNL